MLVVPITFYQKKAKSSTHAYSVNFTEVISVYLSSLQDFQTNSKVQFLYLTVDTCIRTHPSIFGTNGKKIKFK